MTEPGFQDALESIDLKFRAVIEKLRAQGDVNDEAADELHDLLESMDEISEAEFEEHAKTLLGIQELGGEE